MSIETDFDIKDGADEVVALFELRHVELAIERLERLREGQPQVVQDSLDRFVAVELRQEMANLQAIPLNQPESFSSTTLERLSAALERPQFPSATSMDLLSSDTQRFDVYASILAARGSEPAMLALDRGDRVILGLRQESSTLDSSTRTRPGQARIDNDKTTIDESKLGTGVYDDRLVVLWKDAQGSRNLMVSDVASTEPAARYDARARPTPARAGTIYEHVNWMRSEGVDVNGDGIADLGRLAEGTIEMQRTTHPTPGGGGATHFSLRPTAEAVRNGAGLVQRDTNGDGWFDGNDFNGMQPLNNTFKIHMGSRGSTDSAGCQIVHPDIYPDFIAAVTGNPNQNRWQYVLTSTSREQVRELEMAPTQVEPPALPREVAPPAAPAHALPREVDGRPPQRLNIGPPPALGASNSDHPDHAMLQQIRGLVRGLDRAHGREYDSRSEQLSHALLPLAKERGLTRVDQLMLNPGNGQVQRGEHLFLLQGNAGDPAARYASVDTATALHVSLPESAARLEAINQQLAASTQAQQASLQQAPAQPGGDASSLRM